MPRSTTGSGVSDDGLDQRNPPKRPGAQSVGPPLLAAFTIALFLLNLRRAGERVGRLAGHLSTSEKTHEIQRGMLDACCHRPADRDALAERMRDGRF